MFTCLEERENPAFGTEKSVTIYFFLRKGFCEIENIFDSLNRTIYVFRCCSLLNWVFGHLGEEVSRGSSVSLSLNVSERKSEVL